MTTEPKRLVLQRRKGQRIVIDGRITVEFREYDRGKCSLLFEAPADVRIDREEVHTERQKEAEAEFLLQCLNAGYVGNNPMFWQRGGSGYTPVVADAERFTYEEAEHLAKASAGTHSWRIWPVETVLAAMAPTVDAQYLDHDACAASIGPAACFSEVPE